MSQLSQCRFVTSAMLLSHIVGHTDLHNFLGEFSVQCSDNIYKTRNHLLLVQRTTAVDSMWWHCPSVDPSDAIL